MLWNELRPPPNWYVEALIRGCDCIWRQSHKEVTQWGPKCGAFVGWGLCPHEKRTRHRVSSSLSPTLATCWIQKAT